MRELRCCWGLLQLLYRISPILNLFSRRFDAEENHRNRSAFLCDAQLLNGQQMKPLSELPYGAYQVGYNGCEAIAVHNALCLLGKKSSFADVARELERRGLLLGGLGGTNCGAVVDFFKSHGYRTKLLTAKHRDAFDEVLREGEIAVLSYWTGKRLKRPDGAWNTLHTVTVEQKENGILIYNAEGDKMSPMTAKSLSDFLQTGDFAPVMLCAVECC